MIANIKELLLVSLLLAIVFSLFDLKQTFCTFILP